MRRGIPGSCEQSATQSRGVEFGPRGGAKQKQILSIRGQANPRARAPLPARRQTEQSRELAVRLDAGGDLVSAASRSGPCGSTFRPCSVLSKDPKDRRIRRRCRASRRFLREISASRVSIMAIASVKALAP